MGFNFFLYNIGLGNIAGDNAKYRDLILDYNAIDIICRILDRKPP